MPKLIIFRGRNKEGSIELERRRYLIGRGAEADVRVDNPMVSRKHATLEFDGGAWRLKDLETPNGVYVNGEQVRETALFPGDRIELGKHLIVFLGAGMDDDFAGDTLPPLFERRDAAEATTVLSPTEVKSIHEKTVARLKAHIVVTHGRTRREVELTHRQLSIGFSDDCDVRLAGSVLFAKKVAEIVDDGDGYLIRSVSSMVPIKVGGQRVKEQRLRDGLRVEIKDSVVTFFGDVPGLV